jgi:CelD/BcsL family acetyltransferase involved in cellulose biosynthesis
MPYKPPKLSPVSIYSINPVTDARWRDFLDRHPDASIFHTPGWLEALARTYEYEPVVYTTSPGGKELRSGQVFCRINSWVTGKRLVSLPFSDHAALLLENQNDFDEMTQLLQDGVHHRRYSYVEIRPLAAPSGGTEPFAVSKLFYWHRLSLTGDLNSLFKSFHPSCVQRKIRRAEREKLDYIEGRSEKLIQQFYKLLLYSRRRYGLPPQPIAWFRNLVACVGSGLKLRLASRNGTPICGIMTLSYKKTMVYKYGCSDPKYHNLGGMALLFWKAIQDAKNQDFDELDMGRSDSEDLGLMAFKEHWGAVRKLLTYSRYPAPILQSSGVSWQLRLAKKLCGLVPAPTLATAG